MKRFIPALFFIIIQFVNAQDTASCACPDNTMAGTTKSDDPKEIFTFSTGQQIILCGYKNEDAGKPTYSEFILQECGKSEPVDFWEALFSGVVTFDRDIIYIKEIKNLPTGSNRTFTDTHWSTETLQYVDNKLVRKYTINHNIRKYTKAEINLTLKEFEAGSANYNGDVEEVMYRLFVAALSGNKKARNYFNDFEKFTMLDGALSEEYKDLSAMLGMSDRK